MCQEDGEKQNEQNMYGLTRKTLKGQIVFFEIYFPWERRENSVKRSARAIGGTNRRRWERFRVPNSLPFHNRIHRIGGDVLQHLHFAVGPADLHGIDLRGDTEAKMLTQVVLREITPAGSNLAELTEARSKNRYARADRSAIALRADELEYHAMVGIPGVIDQQSKWFSHVKDGHVYVTVIIDIPESDAPAAGKRDLRQPRSDRDILESAVSQVAE